MKKTVITICCFGLLIIVLAGMTGCVSPQEKRGYSPLPQNRPANWENSNNQYSR